MLSFKDISSDHDETANYHLSLDNYNLAVEEDHSMPQHPWKNLVQVYNVGIIVQKYYRAGLLL